MTIQEVYLRTLQKANRNLGSNNILLDKGRFVLLYNKVQVDRILEVYRLNDERIREIQFFLNTDVTLLPTSTSNLKAFFDLPTDYLELSNVYAYADRGKCKDKLINLIEIKDKNTNEIVFDEYNKPSFEYRESSYIIADNKIHAYKATDFDYTKAILSYYRYPTKVDIVGYTDLNGNPSTNIDPEGDQDFIEQVIDKVVFEFAKNNEDTQLAQLNQNFRK
jgi:hypothetical protein